MTIKFDEWFPPVILAKRLNISRQRLNGLIKQGMVERYHIKMWNMNIYKPKGNLLVELMMNRKQKEMGMKPNFKSDRPKKVIKKKSIDHEISDLFDDMQQPDNK